MELVNFVWLFGCLVVWLFGCLVVWGCKPAQNQTVQRMEPYHATQENVAIDPCFSPQGNCAQRIIEALGEAQKHIYLAMFYMTNDELVEALLDAKQRGVHVVAVFDASQGKGFSYLQHGVRLRLHGIPVKYFNDSRKMHTKFAVVDDHLVITGSYNWTESAEHKNIEDVLFVSSADIVAQYQDQFTTIWEQCDVPN